MRVIQHGHDIVEFAGAIKNPHNIIENILDLEGDERVLPVMTPFEDWYEGSFNEETEKFEYNVRKGRKKLVSMSDFNKKKHPEAYQIVSDLVAEPICKPFDECIEIYADLVDVPYEIASRNLDIRLYDAGEGLTPHGDINKTLQNKFSFVIYLNDDYEGGELDFLDLNVTITPTAGSVVAFPSLTEHQALPTMNGIKWHIPYFWYLGFGRVMCNKELGAL